LDRVARDKGIYALKDLSDSLDAEMAGNERQFEVFGIKFPIEDLSRWGIVLEIAILLYFCVHLRELSPKMTSADPGLDVAWVGLYSSWLASSLVWMSVLVLPGIAVILLGMAGARYQGPFSAAVRTNGWDLCMWIVCPSIVCCALASFSCLAARRLALMASHARSSGEESEDKPQQTRIADPKL
jgi:hypothetical protein